MRVEHFDYTALVKRVYDINLNSLGVRREDAKKKPRVEGESFSGSVKVTEFYRALIRTWYHTSNYQRRLYLIIQTWYYTELNHNSTHNSILYFANTSVNSQLSSLLLANTKKHRLSKTYIYKMSRILHNGK
ncbi:MAG: hypothetical protein F6K39_25210 [Okeania sp. SIO3B3]|nr:hypothetical protein [Okeania sp. SIO3B3]